MRPGVENTSINSTVKQLSGQQNVILKLYAVLLVVTMTTAKRFPNFC
jgi:hypothetical protein